MAEIIATTLTVRMCHIAHLPKRKLQAIVAPCELLCLAHLRVDRHGFDGGLNVMWGSNSYGFCAPTIRKM